MPVLRRPRSSDSLQMATVDAMRTANKEMKKQYKGIDIDKIEVGRLLHDFTRSRTCNSPQSIHDDMEDLIEQANEIQESLGRSYGVPDEVDEEDLQAGQSADRAKWSDLCSLQNSMRWDWKTRR